MRSQTVIRSLACWRRVWIVLGGDVRLAAQLLAVGERLVVGALERPRPARPRRSRGERIVERGSDRGVDRGLASSASPWSLVAGPRIERLYLVGRTGKRQWPASRRTSRVDAPVRSHMIGSPMRQVSFPTLAALLIVATPPLASATLVQGAGSLRTECYVQLDLDSLAPPETRQRAFCVDGDPSCDHDGLCNGSCTFRARLCINDLGIRQCTPPPTSKRLTVRQNLLPLPDPLSASVCGEFADVAVPVRGPVIQPRPGKVVLRVVAAPTGGRGRGAASRSAAPGGRHRIARRCTRRWRPTRRW